METGNENMDIVQEPIENSTQFVTQIPGHADNLIKSLNKFLTDQTMSDITIVAGLDESKFTVHRLILSASSEYFLTMFSEPFGEAYEKEVRLTSISGDTLKQLISYCYSGNIIIHQENAQALIEAATKYQFPGIVQASADYLITQLDPQNCIGFLNFAARYDLKALHVTALKMLCDHFTAASKSEEFKQIPLEKLKNILEKDELNVKSEEEIVDAVKIWINEDTNKKCHVPELFNIIRLQLLDDQIIESLMEEYPNIKDLLKNVLKWRTKRRKLVCNSPYRLMVVGGETSAPSIIEYYCPNSKKWKYWRKLPDSRNNYVVTIWDNELHILGGDTITPYKLNVITMSSSDTWQWFRSLNYSSAVSVIEGANPGIYAVDGGSKNIYRFTTTKETLFVNIPTQQAQPKATVNGSFIYVYEPYQKFSKMQKIDTSTADKQWINTSLTNICRRDVQMASMDNLIYVLSRYSNVVECYNTIDDSWKRLSDFPGGCYSLCNFNETLYACTKRHVYTYDEINDVWTEMGSFNEDRSEPHLFGINVGNHPDFN